MEFDGNLAAWQSLAELNLKLWRFEAVTPLQTLPSQHPAYQLGQMMCEGLVMAIGLACFSGLAISEPIGSGIGHYWDVFNIMPRQSLGPLRRFQKCHQYGIMKRAFRPSGSGPFGIRALSGHVWVFQTFITTSLKLRRRSTLSPH